MLFIDWTLLNFQTLISIVSYCDLCGQSDLLNDAIRLQVTRGRRDLLNYPKGHSDVYGRFNLVYDP